MGVLRVCRLGDVSPYCWRMDTGMTHQEAEDLAATIHNATGLPVTVESDGEWFAVEVTKTVGAPRSEGAGRCTTRRIGGGSQNESAPTP